MSLELILGIVALFGTAAIGVPVAYAIIVGVVVYLGVAGQDLAIAGETMVQRLFDGFLLLAVPLFIVSANIMNAGTISDRLLNFCIALVGRFRGGLGHVNVVASLIFSEIHDNTNNYCVSHRNADSSGTEKCYHTQD